MFEPCQKYKWNDTGDSVRLSIYISYLLRTALEVKDVSRAVPSRLLQLVNLIRNFSNLALN